MKKILFSWQLVVPALLLLAACHHEPKPAKPNGEPSVYTTAPVTQPVSGKELYSMYCVRCHLWSGKGGPTPESGPVPGQGVSAMDLQKLNKSEAELVQIISNGWGKMPSFKDSISDGDITRIARYVKNEMEHQPIIR